MILIVYCTPSNILPVIVQLAGRSTVHLITWMNHNKQSVDPKASYCVKHCSCHVLSKINTKGQTQRDKHNHKFFLPQTEHISPIGLISWMSGCIFDFTLSMSCWQLNYSFIISWWRTVTKLSGLFISVWAHIQFLHHRYATIKPSLSAALFYASQYVHIKSATTAVMTLTEAQCHKQSTQTFYSSCEV